MSRQSTPDPSPDAAPVRSAELVPSAQVPKPRDQVPGPRDQVDADIVTISSTGTGTEAVAIEGAGAGRVIVPSDDPAAGRAIVRTNALTGASCAAVGF